MSNPARMGMLLRADQWITICDALLELAATRGEEADNASDRDAAALEEEALKALNLRNMIASSAGLGWFMDEYQEAVSRE